MRSASYWVREEVKGRQNVEAPILSSGLEVKQDGRGNVCQGYLGYFGSNGNSIYDNACYVNLMTSANSRGNGLSVIPENFEKCCALFAARKSIRRTWLNDQDQYCEPMQEDITMIDSYKCDIAYNVDGVVVFDGVKYLYNTDEYNPASDWVREEIKSLKTHQNCVPLTSGIRVAPETLSSRGTLCDQSIGYMNNNSNNVYYNTQGVNLFSTAYSSGNGFSVIPENFHKCCALFAARRSIKRDWLNDKDEYSAPNEEHEKWNEYVNDSVIYSLFNTSSNQSSLRQVSYKNKLWDVENEWFWLSHEQVQKLADEYEIDELYADAKIKGHRTFVLDYIANHPFSEEANAVLAKATEIFEKSMRFRKVMMEEHPEYHLQAWDAGWYQVKLILKEYLKEDLKEFQKVYKVLEQKIQKGVYYFGFLL